MKLIARKPCSFAGEKFFIGDQIPVEYVLDPNGQEKMGTLAIVNDDAGDPAPDESADARNLVNTMSVVIHAEEGDLTLNLTADGLQAVVDVLTDTVEGAEPIVEAMTDGDALILLHCVDGRKGIKAAAVARAQALNAEESEGEQ